MRTARPTRLAAALGAGVLLTGLGATPALASPVSYTHLTLPTKRIV